MPFTLAGFFENQDSATLINIAGIADTSLRVSGDNLIVPNLNFLSGYYAMGANVTRAQLTSPRLLQSSVLDIEPVDLSAAPVSNPPFHDRFENPYELGRGEVLNALAAEGGGGASDASVFVWLSSGAIQPLNSGNIFTVRATGSTTLTADQWSAVTITLDSNLASGMYALVGLRAVGATLFAARAVFPGGGPRPGCIAFDAISDLDASRFRNGRAGEWGRFTNDEPPAIECFASAGDTSQVFYLDVIRVG